MLFVPCYLHCYKRSNKAMFLCVVVWKFANTKQKKNPRCKFKYLKKAKASLKYPYFQDEVLNHFNHGQTIANETIFDFNNPKHKKYFESL